MLNLDKVGGEIKDNNLILSFITIPLNTIKFILGKEIHCTHALITTDPISVKLYR